jgi:hypothetical protein
MPQFTRSAQLTSPSCIGDRKKNRFPTFPIRIQLTVQNVVSDPKHLTTTPFAIIDRKQSTLHRMVIDRKQLTAQHVVSDRKQLTVRHMVRDRKQLTVQHVFIDRKQLTVRHVVSDRKQLTARHVVRGRAPPTRERVRVTPSASCSRQLRRPPC